MIKAIPSAALGAALLAGPALAAAPLPSAAWVISPAEGGCRTDLELAGRSGALAPVTLVSDGERLILRFARDSLPEQAFLAVRIDQKRFSNLMTRTADPAVGELTLSAETEAALRKGRSFDIAWLGMEPMGASLGGSEQGLADLRACGAQAAERARIARDSAAAHAREAEAAAHRRALADEELRTARAQAEAAEAERRRAADEAAARQAELDARRQQAAYEAQRDAYEREMAEREAAEREAYQRRRAYEYQPQPYQPPPWAYRRY
ncbi:hypothetical protein [Phenylobacterium sp. J367]|uniref:hypothetical protein n=1 Tax=Phenylobacterium sp. J367 TaxID=2898435 RepID=UPI002150BE7C|nr:hypothetical protein [Phenylobacterium sp. J367]MCR5878930.1 hypothetical protein [Phenylobacterium sp. J367]